MRLGWLRPASVQYLLRSDADRFGVVGVSFRMRTSLCAPAAFLSPAPRNAAALLND